MININKMIVTIILSCLSYTMQAYVIDYALLQLGTTEIILLGDCHLQMPEDAEHYNDIRNKLQKCSSTLFLIEGIKSEYDKFGQELGLTISDSKQSSNELGIKKLRKDIYFNRLVPSSSSVVMELADQRIPFTSKLFAIQTDTGLFTPMSMTCTDLLLYTQQYLQKLDIFLQKHTHLKAIFEPYKKSGVKAYVDMQKLFKNLGINQQIPIHTAFNDIQAEIYKRKQSVISIVSSLPKDHIFKPYEQTYLYDMAEIGFIQRIIEGCGIYNRIILYAGANHITQVKKLLERCFDKQLKVILYVQNSTLDWDAVNIKSLLLTNQPNTLRESETPLQHHTKRIFSYGDMIKWTGIIGIGVAIAATAYIAWRRYYKKDDHNGSSARRNTKMRVDRTNRNSPLRISCV